MESLKLRENFYWTGIVDDKLRVFDIIMYTCLLYTSDAADE